MKKAFCNSSNSACCHKKNRTFHIHIASLSHICMVGALNDALTILGCPRQLPLSDRWMDKWEEFAALMPCRVIGEVAGNLLVGELKLLGWRDTSVLDHDTPIVPAVN